MADFKSLNGYSVKDGKARQEIESIKQTQEEIVASQLAIAEALKQFSNPNLLINSSFKYVINQRAQTNYNVVDSAIYTIDRWKLSGQNASLKVGTKSITITAGSYECFLSQTFEMSIGREVEPYTVSVKVKDIEGVAECYMTDVSGVSTAKIVLTTGINELHVEGYRFKNIYILLSQNSMVEIEYIKLEKGSVATPFVPKLHDEELLICKRYYQRSESYEYFGPIISMGSNAFRCLTNYSGFRIEPTVKIPSGAQLSVMNKSDDGSSFSADITGILMSRGGNMKLTATGTTVPAGVTAIAQITNIVEFDAELY